MGASMMEIVKFKDGNMFITDEEIRGDVNKLIVQTSKYCKKKKKEIEALLKKQVNVKIIIGFEQPRTEEKVTN